MLEVEDRVEGTVHEAVEDLHEEEGEHEDAAEVVEHHLVVEMLGDTHGLEVDEGVDRGEEEETIADVLEEDPGVAPEEESHELSSAQDTTHDEDGGTEYKARVGQGTVGCLS
jgi:hypothetical protein